MLGILFAIVWEGATLKETVTPQIAAGHPLAVAGVIRIAPVPEPLNLICLSKLDLGM